MAWRSSLQRHKNSSTSSTPSSAWFLRHGSGRFAVAQTRKMDRFGWAQRRREQSKVEQRRAKQGRAENRAEKRRERGRKRIREKRNQEKREIQRMRGIAPLLAVLLSTLLFARARTILHSTEDYPRLTMISDTSFFGLVALQHIPVASLEIRCS